MKRKMLSMNSSTSRPSSRKYSANVRPVSADAQARAGRLVHLAEGHHRLGDDARLGHLVEQVVALAGALADAGEHGVAAVLLGDVADELLDDDRLAHAGAAEDADLAALGEGRDEVDDLDARLEHLGRGGLVLERGRRAVDGVARLRLDGALAVDGLAEHVEHAAQRRGPTGTVMGPPVSTASVPRARPSVVVMATVRTQLLPRCCWTSQVTRRRPWSTSTTALKMAGSWPGGNSMSTTGPVMAMTRPTDAGRGCGLRRRPWGGFLRVGARQDALAPVAISIISRVMFAWRTLL